MRWKTMCRDGNCSAKTHKEQNAENCDYYKWSGCLNRGCFSARPGGSCSSYEARQAERAEARPLEEIVADLRQCVESWEPGARLLGNVRAVDILRVLGAIEAAKTDDRKPEACRHHGRCGAEVIVNRGYDAVVIKCCPCAAWEPRK